MAAYPAILDEPIVTGQDAVDFWVAQVARASQKGLKTGLAFTVFGV